MTLNERRDMEKDVQKGLQQGLQIGLQRGLYKGRVQERLRALSAERALLRRLALRQYDSATAEQLTALLQPITDPEQLADIGEWIIDCETGDELLGRVWSLLDDEDSSQDSASQTSKRVELVKSSKP